MTDEVEEAEVREVTVVPVSLPQTQVILGSAALALMSDADFERNLSALDLARTRADRIKLALMAEGRDYGTVPGVTKAFLWKSGAETLDKAFGLVASFDVRRVTGGPDEPPYSFHAHALIHLGSTDGPVVGEGFGTCNPWESRYRYRKGERVCPNCGQTAVIKGKAEYGGGWLCWTKRDGCGAKWKDGAPEIESQDVGQIENENPWDLENTIAKMAEKRAHVDGSIRATGTSGLFTQDDDSPAVHSEAPKAEAPKPLDPSGETLTRKGVITRTGTVAKGQGRHSDLDARQTPDGYHVGFRLEIAGGKAIPQVVLTGPVGAALVAKVGRPDTILGDEVRVTGTLFEVRQPERRMTHRLVADTLETPEWTVPGNAPAPRTGELTPEEQASLDALDF